MCIYIYIHMCIYMYIYIYNIPITITLMKSHEICQRPDPLHGHLSSFAPGGPLDDQGTRSPGGEFQGETMDEASISMGFIWDFHDLHGWLVVTGTWLLFFHIFGIIVLLTFIFFRWVETTNQMGFPWDLCRISMGFHGDIMRWPNHQWTNGC